MSQTQHGGEPQFISQKRAGTTSRGEKEQALSAITTAKRKLQARIAQINDGRKGLVKKTQDVRARLKVLKEGLRRPDQLQREINILDVDIARLEKVLSQVRAMYYSAGRAVHAWGGKLIPT